LLLIVIRKMLCNKWMVLCLLIGSILAVAMVSSIPVYTDGVLQRMLVRDLENYQEKNNVFPGGYHVRTDYKYKYKEVDRPKAYAMFNKKISDVLIKEIKLPALVVAQRVTLDNMKAAPEVKREEKPLERYVRLEGTSDFQNHVKMSHGRIFSDKMAGDVIEVAVTENTMKELDLRLDETYVVGGSSKNVKATMKIKVVGVFTLKDEADPYWYQGLGVLNKSFVMDYALLQDTFVLKESPFSILLTEAQWFYALDYHKITIDGISELLKTYDSHMRWYGNYRGVAELKMPAIEIIEKYNEREKQLRIMLWVLIVPILLMLAFYIFMVSQLIIDHEKNEIAVLKSRGASGAQVFHTYLIESLLISVIAILTGPPLGLFICSVLGASNGFLEFVQRTALPISLSGKAYLYSLFAVALFMATMLIPVLISTRATIVQHKQKKSRGGNAPTWKKFFFDIILLGLSIYGRYSYSNVQKTLNITGAKGTELSIDPLLFLVSTAFVLGAGLLFLRLFPFVIRFIFWLGRKLWSPVLYASFIQVGRSGGQEQFIMLFMILTLSTGIFSANAARTINENMESKIRYTTGSELVLKAHWESNQAPAASGPPMGGGAPATVSSNEPIRYIEPPFMPYTQISGVETATKVLRKTNMQVQYASTWIDKTYVMGIIPEEFLKVNWFRQGLLPYQLYQYLELMAEDPTAFVVSSSYQKKYKAKVGDTIAIRWGDQGYLEGTIYAFVDYWPTYNPNAKDGTSDLIVANLEYINMEMSVEPYEVWIKKKPGANNEQIYTDIEAKKLQVEEIKNADFTVIENKNDPMLQGTNGVLTLGFVVTIAISAIGFLIYWILSIKRRVLQFGILRAIGLSMHKIIGMLVCEHVMISAVAIFVGIIIGGITCDLFVPLLQMAYSAEQQILPFKVVAYGQDYLRLYAVVISMLLVGFAVLGTIISKIKISQALKLGED
jgi:putative ABC transport system permease protein